MKREVTYSKSGLRSIVHPTRIAVAILLVGLVVVLAACSTINGSSEGTWTTSYFTDPDRVWGAIQIALIDLDYEVESENRPDGVIRAKSEPTEDGTVIALAIDQVMRTEDQVHVYIKPSFATDDGSQNPDSLKAAADELIKALDEKLRG
jgi:uncharacterized lipoprotein